MQNEYNANLSLQTIANLAEMSKYLAACKFGQQVIIDLKASGDLAAAYERIVAYNKKIGFNPKI